MSECSPCRVCDSKRDHITRIAWNNGRILERCGKPKRGAHVQGPHTDSRLMFKAGCDFGCSGSPAHMCLLDLIHRERQVLVLRTTPRPRMPCKSLNRTDALIQSGDTFKAGSSS